MKRVVITGLGIVSSIGNNAKEVTYSLKQGKSGIVFAPTCKENGLRSHVHGAIKNLNFEDHIDRRNLRFMAQAAAYSYIAMNESIKDANLSVEQISNPRTGLIAGSGGASNENVIDAYNIAREKGVKRVGPYRVTRTMGSTVSACLATSYKIKGINYSISSACSTSAHSVCAATEKIQLGKQDIVFAGGGEELHWTMTLLFDAMGALSTKYNDNPELASRTYDKDRDGFVIAGGGGMVVLEEYEHARKRNAKIYAEIVGVGANSDGFDMVAPSGEGAERCMRLALNGIDNVDYINPHGTSTPIGDIKEINAIKKVFTIDKLPFISATKAMTGHSLGAAGVQEIIYTLLMLDNDFIAPSINIENLDKDCEGVPIATSLIENAGLQTVMSNSFGFGGTNASIVMRKI